MAVSQRCASLRSCSTLKHVLRECDHTATHTTATHTHTRARAGRGLTYTSVVIDSAAESAATPSACQGQREPSVSAVESGLLGHVAPVVDWRQLSEGRGHKGHVRH